MSSSGGCISAGSLARHLFARYPLPGFLDAGWLSGFSQSAEAQREWFIHPEDRL